MAYVAGWGFKAGYLYTLFAFLFDFERTHWRNCYEKDSLPFLIWGGFSILLEVFPIWKDIF